MPTAPPNVCIPPLNAQLKRPSPALTHATLTCCPPSADNARHPAKRAGRPREAASPDLSLMRWKHRFEAPRTSAKSGSVTSQKVQAASRPNPSSFLKQKPARHMCGRPAALPATSDDPREKWLGVVPPTQDHALAPLPACTRAPLPSASLFLLVGGVLSPQWRRAERDVRAVAPN